MIVTAPVRWATARVARFGTGLHWHDPIVRSRQVFGTPPLGSPRRSDRPGPERRRPPQPSPRGARRSAFSGYRASRSRRISSRTNALQPCRTSRRRSSSSGSPGGKRSAARAQRAGGRCALPGPDSPRFRRSRRPGGRRRPSSARAARGRLRRGRRAELYEDIHHLRPLAFEGLPLAVEVHSRPKWVEPLVAPSAAELLEAALPGTTGVRDVLALPPEQHAILLAAHRGRTNRSAGFATSSTLRPSPRAPIGSSSPGRQGVGCRAPLACLHRRSRRGFSEARRVRGRSGSGRRTSIAQRADGVRESPAAVLSDFWALPPRAAVGRLPQRFGEEFGAAEDEGWRAKLQRTTLAMRNASRRGSEHDREVEARARDRVADRDGPLSG